MLAHFTHILTLVAFAVHAVLGCCGHHEHAEFATHSPESAPPAACQTQPESGCCSKHTPHSEDDQPQDSHGCQTDAVQPSHSEHCPCNDSHSCSQTRCIYVNDNSSLEFSPLQRCDISHIALDAIGLSTIQHFADCHSNLEMAFPCGYAPPNRCVLHQTWQL